MRGGNGDVLTCPQCQSESTLSSDKVDSLLPNVLVRKKLQEVERRTLERQSEVCGGCDNDFTVALYRCIECEELLCEDCVEAHRRVKFTREHEIATLKDYAAKQKSSAEQETPVVACLEHNQESLDMFCKTCEKLTCVQCRTESHTQHELLSTSEAAQTTRPTIASLLESTRQHIPELQKSVYEIIKRYARLQNKIDDVTWEIRKTSRRLIQAVKDREHELLRELREYKESKGAMLIGKKEELEKTLVRLIDGCDFTEEILTQGQEMDVLMTKKLVCDRLELLNTPRTEEELQKSKVTFEANEAPVLGAIRKAFGSVQVHNAPPADSVTSTDTSSDHAQSNPSAAAKESTEEDKAEKPAVPEQESHTTLTSGAQSEDLESGLEGEVGHSNSEPSISTCEQTKETKRERKGTKGRRFSLQLSPRKKSVETATKAITTSLVISTTDSRGKPRDVEVQLESPDSSVISAQILDNKNGTYTVFYCPRTPGEHNLYVSVSGKNIKHGARILNMYGSFHGLKGEELTLVCKALCLIRWQITPGLVTIKGDKKVANAKLNFESSGVPESTA